MADLSISAAGPAGTRRTEDISLDLMKFVALTTGYGKSAAATGFSGKPGAGTNEEYADALLELYQRCREVVEKPRG